LFKNWAVHFYFAVSIKVFFDGGMMMTKKLPCLRNYKTMDGKSKSPAGLKAWECKKTFWFLTTLLPTTNPAQNQCDRAIFLKKSGNPYVVSK
jgi:hypothetical protein